ncbi:MAG: transporter [Marmoricola sp.]|nr:transporter [Marmoricola sp.]
MREYLDLDCTDDTAERERVYGRLVAEADQVRSLGPRYRAMVRDEPELVAQVERARERHAETVSEAAAQRL